MVIGRWVLKHEGCLKTGVYGTTDREIFVVNKFVNGAICEDLKYDLTYVCSSDNLLRFKKIPALQ